MDETLNFYPIEIRVRDGRDGMVYLKLRDLISEGHGFDCCFIPPDIDWLVENLREAQAAAQVEWEREE